MTYPTFTNGQVLPASDLNAIGLWLVKSQTVGTGVSSVTVTGAFSADYNAYKIVASGVASTGASGSASLQLSGLTTGYYATIIYSAYTPGALALSVDNNQASWNFAGSFSTDGLVMDCDVINPFLASPTQLASGSYSTTSIAGPVNGRQSSSTSVTGFTIATPGGTMTGGTISVYGYRK